MSKEEKLYLKKLEMICLHYDRGIITIDELVELFELDKMPKECLKEALTYISVLYIAEYLDERA